VTLIVGLIFGVALTKVLPPQYPADHDAAGEAHSTQAAPPQPPPHEGEPASGADEGHGQDAAAGGEHAPAASEHAEPAGQGHESGTEVPADSEHGGDGEHEGGGGGGEHAFGPTPTIPILLVIPFALLLASIALMPFINEHFWHQHFPDFAFFLGGMMVSYYALAFNEPGFAHGLSYGVYQLKHTGLEYYAFIALVGGLYVSTGGILISVKGPGRPLVNTGLLAFGAVIANIVGTAGASVLLIRPMMRINKGRLQPMHVVFFIFIVSNCGGSLTPIGDPPLYLGFLKGVPFTWTLTHLWKEWATCVGILLVLFFLYDTFLVKAKAAPDGPHAESSFGVTVSGFTGIIALGLIIFGVFMDPILEGKMGMDLKGLPVGATFQVLVAAGAYFVANKENQKANDFNFFPVKEVGLLFLGIFATMIPALGYLSAHGADLGLNSATRFYFGTGVLSAVLDNAPTYVNFMTIALAADGFGNTPDQVLAFLDTEIGVLHLAGISLGAVFFGAMTYIGNAPNFMVRAIAESSGQRMPSFFGYTFRAFLILLPTLVITWAIWLR
jgi:Na+/H+ antiporter NhaD/arsenite permease-like protein